MTLTTTGEESPAVSEQIPPMESLSPTPANVLEASHERSHTPLESELVTDELAGSFRYYRRAKSPFELGRKENVLKSSSKAIIDKASVMDISGPSSNVEEDIQNYFRHIYQNLIFDMASIQDITAFNEASNIEIVVVEEGSDESSSDENDDTTEKQEKDEEGEQPEENKNEGDVVTTTDEQPKTPEPNEQEIAAADAEVSEIIESSEQQADDQQVSSVQTAELETTTQEQQQQSWQPAVQEEELIEEIEEEEEEMNPEVIPGLENAVWDKIKDEDWDFEYEPLVTPYASKKSSMTGEPSEMHKMAEWINERKEMRPMNILSRLTDRAAPIGGTVKLTTTVDGNGVRVNWKKDGEYVERSSKLNVSIIPPMFILTISDLDRKDEGEYTAEIIQGKQKMETSAKVTVLNIKKEKKVKPFAIRIRDFYHLRYNCLILEAQISGSPRPEVTWYKDDEQVEMNDRTRTDETEGDEIYWLMFHDPVPSDSGVYRCVAENKSGKCSIEHEVVFTKKIPFIHYAGMGHATPKLLTEEQIKEQEAKEQEFKRKAAERVADELAEIDAILRAEELAKFKRESVTPAPTEGGEEGEGEAKEGEEGEEEEAPKKPPPKKEKPKEEAQPYVEESIAIRLSKEKLKWNALLTSRSIPEGGSTKLQCICSGPGSTFKWTKDGKNVEWSDRLKNTSQMGIGEVIITKAQKKDAGVYTCIAKNARGEIETSCRVTILPPLEKQSILSPPTFPRGIQEKYSILVDELILEVAIRGVPQPSFVWKKDGEPVKEDGRIVFHEEKDNVYQILIHRPVPEDGGKYTVVATNSEGKKEVSHIVNFESKQDKARPTVFGIFHKGSVVKPEDSSLEEIIHPPKPAKKEGEEEEEKKGPKVQKEMGSGGTKATHFGALHHIKWVSQLRDQFVKEGTNVKLQCYLDGPQPTMKWFKNDKPLAWGQTIVNKSRDVHGCCEILKITMADAGEYLCVAKNPYNEIETKCKVTVYRDPKKQGDPTLIKPTFGRVMDHYDIVTGDIIIEVQVRGQPHPVLTWVRDGQKVEPNEKYFFMREPDGVYKLCVHNPSLLDAGYYTVKAKNKAGEVQIKHKVEFLGKERYEHVPLIAHADKHHGVQEETEEVVDAEQAQAPIAPPPVVSAVETTENEEAPAEGEEAPVAKRKDPRRWEKSEPSPGCKRCKAADVLTFESKLRNVTAPEGTVVKLICSVSGNNPKFSWFRNNNKLVFDKQVVNKGKLGISSVEIIGATPKHSGTYKVVCENGPCQIESECQVTIFENMEATVPPTFTRLVKEYYDIRTNDLILEIHCRAVPRPTIKFIKDCLDVSNQEYFPPGKYEISREAEGIYKLAIHAPTRQDSGRYVCEASNKAGKQEISYQLKVKEISEYTYMRGIVTADPKLKKKYDDDEEIVIRSRLPSMTRTQTPAPTPTPAPAPKVEAVADGITEAQLSETPAGEPEENPDENMTPEELEKARVMAATPPEQKDKEFSDHKYALNFIAQLRDQMAIEGGTTRFVCSIDGWRPTLTWYKNNQKIEFGGNVKNTSKDTIGSIQLQGCKVSDSGVYKCIAANKYGQISTWARLRVISKGTEELGVAPQFARVRDYYDIPTNQIIVEARILGTAPLEILWYKDCRDIHNDDKYLFGREPGGVHKLYISNPVRRDTGTYMIQVKNAYGYEQVKHEVRFWDKEEYLYVPGINHADPKDKRKHMDTVKLVKKEPEQPEEPRQVEHKSRPEIMALEPPTKEVIEERAKEDQKLRKARILQPDPIEFITRLRNQMLVKGSTIHLSCCISENNRLDAAWFKDDEPLELTPRVKATLNKESAVATLVIKDATLEDSGIYKCAFKTKRGPIEGQCKVEIFALEESSPEDVPPTFITQIKDYYRPITNDLVLECKIRANPRPRCRWQRDGLFVDHSDKYEPYFMEDGTVMLVVNNPKMIDSGRYLLVVENRVKRVEVWHEVHFEPKYEEKKRIKYDDVIIENEVHPRVYPKPKEPTPPPPVEETPAEEEEAEKEPEEEDWGVKKESSPEDVPPTFITQIKDYYRPITNDLVLECKIRANPRPRCRWQRDGLFVDHSDKYEPYFMEDGTVMLVVNNPKMIDSGRYLLVVENRVKRVEVWHEVHFEPKYEEKKRIKYDDVIIENEVHPRVYPKPKEPTPPPPVEETPAEEEEAEKEPEEEDWGVKSDTEEEQAEEEE
uniref:CSON014485 protein n=1 Tax=Culicoides sonorensis TaxID=179676 RepID=A0A336MAS9_CULSO